MLRASGIAQALGDVPSGIGLPVIVAAFVSSVTRTVMETLLGSIGFVLALVLSLLL